MKPHSIKGTADLTEVQSNSSLGFNLSFVELNCITFVHYGDYSMYPGPGVPFWWLHDRRAPDTRRDYVYFDEGDTAVFDADVRAAAARARKRHMPQPPGAEELAHPPAHAPEAAAGAKTLSPPRTGGEGALRGITFLELGIQWAALWP